METHTDSLSQNSLWYLAANVEVKIVRSRVTQFKNFGNELFIKANLNNPEKESPYGIVIETKQHPKAEDPFAYVGTIKNFQNPDGALEVYEKVGRPITCKIDP